MGFFPARLNQISASGFFFSPGGKTSLSFTPRVTGSPATGFSALGVAPGRAMLVDNNNHIFLSLDGGITWNQKTDPPVGAGVAGLLLFENGWWLCGSNNGNIVRSNDNGTTWNQVATNLGASSVVALASSAAGNALALGSNVNPGANFDTSANDGAVWAAAGSVNKLFNQTNVLWDGAQYVTVGQDSLSNPCVWTSATGAAWANTEINFIAEFFSQQVCSIAISGVGQYAALMGSSNTVRVAATAAGIAAAADIALPGANASASMLLYANGFYYVFDGTLTGVWRSATPQTAGSWVAGALNAPGGVFNQPMVGGYDSTNKSLIVLGPKSSPKVLTLSA